MNLLIRKVQAKLLDYKSKRLNRDTQFLPFNDIKEAIILFNLDNTSKIDIIEYYKLLTSYGINATLFCLSCNMEILDIDTRIVYLKESDVSFNGKIDDIKIEELFSKYYDVLFDLRRNGNVVSNYIKSRINSKFVVACSSNINDVDILINTDGNLETFVNNSIELLMKITK